MKRGTKDGYLKQGDSYKGYEISRVLTVNSKRKLEMICHCGNLFQILQTNIRNRGSAGCRECSKKPAIDAKKKHGLSKHPLYKTYKAMLHRCNNEKDPQYYNYGGRGITVCDRWLESFENFLEDMGERPEGTTLDRINNNQGYQKDNCRWATQTEQCRNTRKNHLLTYKGETLSLEEWGEKYSIKPNTILTRIRRGWSVEDSITKEVRG